MKSFKRVSVVFLIILMYFLLWHLPRQQFHQVRSDFEVASPESILLEHQNQILEDRQILSGYDVFKPSKGERDAGPYLNPLVSFQETGDSKAKLALPPDLLGKLRKKDWVGLSPDFTTLKLDFSWMRKLHDYDHWSPEYHNPQIDLKKRPALSTFPVPYYADLIHWSKLRLIHGRLNADMPAALRDVRQLARLIFTTDYLVAAMATISILRFEGMFIQNYNPKNFSGWKPIDQGHLTRAKRYFYGTPAMVDPRLSSETYERFSESDVGKCQMISEGIFLNQLLQNDLRILYSGKLGRFGETLEQSLRICRKSIAQLVWKDPEWRAVLDEVPLEIYGVKVENDSDWRGRILKVFPSLRLMLALNLASISSPNYLRQYQDRPHKEE